MDERSLHRRMIARGLPGLALVFIASCSNSKVTEPQPLDYAVTLEASHDSLGAVLNESINEYLDGNGSKYVGNDSSFRPRDLDFSGVHGMYRQLVNAFPDSTAPKFGAAMTGVLAFLADPTFNSLIDQFKQVYDTLQFNPFNPASPIRGLTPAGSLSPAGLPMAPAGILSVIPSPMRLEQAVVASAAATPQISDIQANLEAALLPRVVEARNWMLDVLEDTSFSFALTPEMQGNPGADTLFFDRAVFQVALATCYAGEAALHILLARNLDIGEYTVEATEAAMDRNSSFLDLKAGGVGANHMSTAGDRILSAQEVLSAAVSSLLAELDAGVDQSRDFFRVHEWDRSSLQAAQDSLASLHLSLTAGPRLVSYNVNYSLLTVTLDLRKFFDAPMDNPKRFLPEYTVSMTKVEDAYKAFADLHYSRDRYWSMLADTPYSVTRPMDTPLVPVHLPDADTDEFYSLIATDPYYPDTTYQYYLFGWDDIYTWCYGCGYFAYYSYNYFRYSELYETPDEITVCYMWAADTYDTWDWPDPTFNGLLPTMTSANLRSILTGNFDFLWSKADCGTGGVHVEWPQEP